MGFDHVEGDCAYEDWLIVVDLVSKYLLQYIKHLAFNTTKHGWNVVVSNHRGLGGVPVTVSFISSLFLAERFYTLHRVFFAEFCLECCYSDSILVLLNLSFLFCYLWYCAHFVGPCFKPHFCSLTFAFSSWWGLYSLGEPKNLWQVICNKRRRSKKVGESLD